MCWCGAKVSQNSRNRGPVNVNRTMQKLRHFTHGKLYVKTGQAKVLKCLNGATVLSRVRKRGAMVFR